MQITHSKTADVVIIGRDDGHTFGDLLQLLRRNDQVRVIAEHQTLSAALKAAPGQTMSADFVIVLQSWSDEFAQHEITDLIGRMMFGRVLCCYGPWCASDGRSHELWPVAFRIPAASAVSLVELELAGFQADSPGLFPMSAGEEVFAHRSQFPDTTSANVRRKAIVISDDAELRATVAGILAALNCECKKLPRSASAIRSHFASQSDSHLLAIIDLDDAKGDVQVCLDLLRSECPMATFVGMSVFAASPANSAVAEASRPSHVVDKTELLLQLQSLRT